MDRSCPAKINGCGLDGNDLETRSFEQLIHSLRTVVIDMLVNPKITQKAAVQQFPAFLIRQLLRSLDVKISPWLDLGTEFSCKSQGMRYVFGYVGE